MRTMPIGAPFSIARIGSTRPALVATLVEPAASCWTTAALDWANTVSMTMSSAANKPFFMPIWSGQALAEEEFVGLLHVFDLDAARRRHHLHRFVAVRLVVEPLDAAAVRCQNPLQHPLVRRRPVAIDH